jgi:hypothetical protein
MDFEYVLYWGEDSKLSDEFNFYLYLLNVPIYQSGLPVSDTPLHRTKYCDVKWESPKDAVSIHIHAILFFTQRGFRWYILERRFLNTIPFGRFVLAFKQQNAGTMGQRILHMEHLSNVFENTAFHFFSTGS